ncbi:MAG: hypothetical protein J6C37_03490 [Roseburia sp.]|nr:hypothetical protein [Roseburia sp.]
MKKLTKHIVTMALFALLTCSVQFPVSAAQVSGDVLYGTPVMDGVLDELYTVSASFELDNPNFYVWGDCTGTDTTAKGYMLWDENYLYYAVDVQDATPATAGPEAGWQDDCVEMWFLDEYFTYKVHTSSSGLHFLGSDADGKTPYDFSGSQACVTTTDTGYVVEVALPFNKLETGRTFSMAMQVCDITSDDPANGTAHGNQVPADEYVCVDTPAAPSTKVAFGTPVLDGQMDDIYTKSAGIELDNFNFYVWGDCTGTDTTATGYFLWDNDFLYYAVEVQDATPATAGPEAGWQDDCVEMWFLDEYFTYKVHTSSSGLHFLGSDADGKAAYDFSGSQAFATTTDTGYVVEVALPFNNLANDRTFSMALQINDITSDDPGHGAASGNQVPATEYTLVGGVEPIITEVQKGTPELDGQMDDIYTTSANFVLDNPNFYVWGDCTGTDTTAKGYFLWDENYLYYAVEVKDATPATAGPEAGWQDDCVEMWFLDEYITYKVHTSSSGLHFLGSDADGKTPYDFSGSQAFVTATDDGYVVEVALPFNALDGGRTFSMAMQINDITSDDPGNGTAHGDQVPATEYTLVGKAEAPSEPSEEVETPAENPVDENPAEETSNVGVIIAIIAAIIVITAVAVVVVKKKKTK